MKHRSLWCLVVISVLLSAVVLGEDSYIFHALFDQINSVVAPKFATNEPYKVPQEIFLMNLPGQTINPDDFDEALWKANNYEETDPSYSAFMLTDSIPAGTSPYFVDTGKKVSVLYKRFLENYVLGNKKSQTSAEVERYRNALKKIMNEDSSPSQLAVSVNTTRNAAKDNYAQLLTLRNDCLNTKSASICARKAVLWGESAQDKYTLYMTLQKELQSAQSKVMALQFKSIDTTLIEAYEQFLNAKRACVGAKSFLGDYMQTRYEPSDFWKWWRTDNNVASFTSAFTTVKVESSSGTKVSSAIVNKVFWNIEGAYANGIVEAKSSGTASKTKLKVSVNGATTTLRFDLASVKVLRPWFDASLFDLTPLGIEGVPSFYWSDGRYKGIFPWFITKLVIAKNIFMDQTQLSSEMQAAISTAKTETTASVTIGPFVAGGTLATDSSTRDSAKEFTINGNSITIAGPQIIGYVMSKTSPFPNWDKSRYKIRA